MSWGQALANLATLTVPGVTTSYGLDALPGVLPAAHLPALVPTFPERVNALGQDEQGLSTLTYDGAAWRASLTVDHLMIWSPTAAHGGLHTVLPELVGAVDGYLAALSADGWLGGALHEPLAVTRVLIGVEKYAGVAYYGARFRHRWVVTIG